LADLQENMRAGVIERIRAAEGFIYPSDPVRRERYAVIISGILQTIQNLNTLWTVLSLPPSPLFRVALVKSILTIAINATRRPPDLSFLTYHHNTHPNNRRHPPSAHPFRLRKPRSSKPDLPTFIPREPVSPESDQRLHAPMGKVQNPAAITGNGLERDTDVVAHGEIKRHWMGWRRYL
jgi:hypothetical protein